MSEPKYDEDLVNLGYLKKIVADPEGNLENIYQNVSKHYASKPQPPYYKGDTWIDGTIIYTCINDRTIGTYQDSDWTTESGAKEEAEKKNKVFLRQPSNYNVGDMWILQTDNDHKAGKKGEILISTAGRRIYDEDDWINMLGYGTIRSINEVANNLNDAIERLEITQGKNDGLITIFYSNLIPETPEVEDLWFVTETADEYIKGNLYKYNGISWEQINDTLTIIAFEEANEARLVSDGKIQCFYNNSMPTENMSVGDIWIHNTTKKLHRYNGTNWVAVYDTRINEIRKDLEIVTETTTEINTDLGNITQRVTETENVLEATNNDVVATNQKVSQLEIKTGQIQSTVSKMQQDIGDIANITITSEGTGTRTLENINESEPIHINIYPTEDDISYLYPSSKLFPSANTFLKTRTLRFTSGDYTVTYELPANLRRFNDVYDEFVLNYDTQECYVIHRIGIDSNGDKYVLAEEVRENFPYPIILLQAGDYTINLDSVNNAYIFIRLMASNIYTNQFATRVEMDSKITQTAESITSEVNNTLERYDTSEEVNSKITQKAGEITSNVSKNYATKNELTTARTEIKQTTDSISSEVSKKVGNNEVISKINQSAESVSINANKVDLSGYVTISNLQTAGKTTINGSNITTGTIDASKVTVKNLNASNISSGTIDASKISVTNLNANNITSGTISASKISGGSLNLTGTNTTITSTNFNLDKDGNITAKGGKIGGWEINSSCLMKSIGKYNLELRTDRTENQPTMLIYDTESDRYNFYVASDGYLYARNAEINGTINATSGTFKNCNITSSCTISGTAIANSLEGVDILVGSVNASGSINSYTMKCTMLEILGNGHDNNIYVQGYEGVTDTLNGLRFINGICVGTA